MNDVKWSWATSAPEGWDEYVRSHTGSGAFHAATAVAIGTKSFGLPAHFLSVRGNKGGLRGVLPLVEQRLIPWTRTLVSLPFFTHGGPLADDEDALAALLEGAGHVARVRNVDQLVLRSAVPLSLAPYAPDLHKVKMVLDLPDTVEELARRLGSKLRSQIKRAERVTPVVSVGSVELLDDFYSVFRSVMRDLGTPVYPRAFFDNVADALGNNSLVMVVRVDGQPVSGAFISQWRDVMEVPWAGTLHSMNSTAINMRLYWEMLQLAVARGCAEFDFGRCSIGAGTFRFKAQWGATPRQLYWYTWRIGRDGAVIPSRIAGEGRALLPRLWSKLPVPIASWVGARISSHLPW